MFSFFNSHKLVSFPNKFDPQNANHLDVLTKEIATFKQKLAEIKKIDHAFCFPAAASIPLLIFYSVPWGAVILTASYLGNLTLRQPYQDALDRLVQTYEWCARSGTDVTHSKPFLDLLKLIESHMTTKELLSAWNDSQKLELSDDFKKIIMKKNPHVKFPKKDQSFVGKLLFPEAESKSEAKSDSEDAQELSGIFSQIGNAVWFHFYGHRQSKQQNEALKKAEVIAEALKLR